MFESCRPVDGFTRTQQQRCIPHLRRVLNELRSVSGRPSNPPQVCSNSTYEAALVRIRVSHLETVSANYLDVRGYPPCSPILITHGPFVCDVKRPVFDITTKTICWMDKAPFFSSSSPKERAVISLVCSVREMVLRRRPLSAVGRTIQPAISGWAVCVCVCACVFARGVWGTAPPASKRSQC